jgi:pSer/pThr/pTyr-binding forkhead associated (FHA) protein
MYRVICDYCGEESIFPIFEEKPDICSHCNSSLKNLNIDQITDNRSESIDKIGFSTQPTLILIFQKTGEEIRITAKKTILGRESYGYEVLGKIGYISGIHCVIEYSTNEYVITDLDSKNGTYISISKIDCQKNPKQILKDGELLFLGKEPFLVKFEKDTEIISNETNKTQESQLVLEHNQSKSSLKPIKYRCRSCGVESDLRERICKVCNAFDSMEILES